MSYEDDLDLIIDKRGDRPYICDNWQKRLSPNEYHVEESSSEHKDFFDRVTKKDKEPTEEDKKLIEEQKQTGESIDRAYKKEQLLRNNEKELSINDYRNILYRLPISEDIMEKLYRDIVKNNILDNL